MNKTYPIMQYVQELEQRVRYASEHTRRMAIKCVAVITWKNPIALGIGIAIGVIVGWIGAKIL